jgi:hypothetical protein
MSRLNLKMSVSTAVVPMNMDFPEVDFTARTAYQTALEVPTDEGTGNVSIVPVASADK